MEVAAGEERVLETAQYCDGRREDFMENKIFYSPMERNHLVQVIALLQNISEFLPGVDGHDEIWLRHSDQSNVFSIVAQQSDGFVVGFGTLLLESKIRGGKTGHIEDIVTHPDFRGLGIGRSIVESLTLLAGDEQCYKVTLHCKPHNTSFYEKSGFKIGGASMQKLL